MAVRTPVTARSEDLAARRYHTARARRRPGLRISLQLGLDHADPRVAARPHGPLRGSEPADSHDPPGRRLGRARTGHDSREPGAPGARGGPHELSRRVRYRREPALPGRAV